eukprot:jgi/Ulvmu1/3474/UM016_0094.1
MRACAAAAACIAALVAASCAQAARDPCGTGTVYLAGIQCGIGPAAPVIFSCLAPPAHDGHCTHDEYAELAELCANAAGGTVVPTAAPGITGCYALDSPHLLALGVPLVATSRGLDREAICRQLPRLVPAWLFGGADVIHTNAVSTVESLADLQQHWTVNATDGRVDVVCDPQTVLQSAPSPDDGRCAAVVRASCAANETGDTAGNAGGAGVSVIERAFELTNPPGVDCAGPGEARLPVVAVSAAWQLPPGASASLEVVDQQGRRDVVHVAEHGRSASWTRLALFPSDQAMLKAGDSAVVMVRLTVRAAEASCVDVAAVAIDSVRLYLVHVA